MHTTEIAHRTAKAIRLADVVCEQFPDDDPADLAYAVGRLDDLQWAALARLAGTRAPSDATKSAVAAVLTERGNQADPFNGLVG